MTTATAQIPYRASGEWGFSNSEQHIESVRQFRDAAVEDGWSIEGTYEPYESVDRASRLTREGFVMQILTRDNSDKSGKFKFEAAIHIWGPDKLAVAPPEFYSFADILARTRVCNSCGKKDVETTRYSFAGRCCEACLPEMRRKHEQPGWCD